MFEVANVEKVVRHLIRFGSDRTDAEDLAQETLAIAWKKRAERDPARSLDGWLYGIARNVYRNHARGARRDPQDRREVDAIDRAEVESMGVEVIAVREVLAGLPESVQDLVILHLLEEHTLKETAELLAIPFDTAKDRLKRARETMRADFDDGAPRERARTRQIGKVVAAGVLAGLLGTIASTGAASAATAAGVAGGVARSVARRWAIGAALGGLAAGGAIGAIAHATLAPKPPAPVAPSIALAAIPPPAPAAPVTPDAAAAPIDAMPAPDARPPSTTTSPRGAGVDPEVQTIDQARVALARGATDDALRALMSHERRFPHGQLAEERDVMLIEAYLDAGKPDLARERLATYRTTYPNGLQAGRVRELSARLAAPPTP